MTDDYVRHKRAVYAKFWRRDNPDYMMGWYRKNRDKWKKIRARRRHKLKWVRKYPNPFDNCEQVEDHHIDNIYVVSLPKDLHRLGGEYGGRNTKKHRINLSYIVNQIYGEE